MSESIDPEAKVEARKLVLLVVAILAVLGIIIFVLSLFSQKSNEPVVFNLSDNEKVAAEEAARSFVEKAANFGLDSTVTGDDSYNYVSELLNKNKGNFQDASLGKSRSEAYSDLRDFFDVNSPLDSSDLFVKNLVFYPDWSGQIVSYSSSEPLYEIGKPSRDGDKVLLPVKVSFTSTINLVKKGSDKWDAYQSKEFVLVPIVLSLQNDGTWRLWSVETVASFPYVVSTWDSPDWQKYPLNTSLMKPVTE